MSTAGSITQKPTYIEQVLIDISNRMGWGITTSNVQNYPNALQMLAEIPASENSNINNIGFAYNPFNVANAGHLPAGTTQGGTQGDILAFPSWKAGTQYTADFIDNFGNPNNRYNPLLAALYQNAPVNSQMGSAAQQAALQGWSDSQIGKSYANMTNYSKQLLSGSPIGSGASTLSASSGSGGSSNSSTGVNWWDVALRIGLGFLAIVLVLAGMVLLGITSGKGIENKTGIPLTKLGIA